MGIKIKVKSGVIVEATIKTDNTLNAEFKYEFIVLGISSSTTFTS